MATKKPAPYFVSYPHHDKDVVDSLLGELQPHLAVSRSYDFSDWRDTALLAGEDWKGWIFAELERARIGLLMLTPTFFGRSFITDEELPRLAGKLLIPVLVRPIDLARQDTHGLGKLQIFATVVRGRRPYSQCTSARQRETFALELYQAIENRLDRDL